jgi:hypothetical protein
MVSKQSFNSMRWCGGEGKKSLEADWRNRMRPLFRESSGQGFFIAPALASTFPGA